ncbi:MAG: peptidase M48, partial [Gammaproteobacteria bacterium]
MRKIATNGGNLATLSVILSVFLGGCAVNPVTGERQLALISTPEQIAIGEEQYFPSRQMQGGDYVVDPALTNYVAEVGQRIA